MSQPVSGDRFTFVVAAGTSVVKNQKTVLRSIYIPGTYVGTVEFYDSSTVVGTAASNKITEVVLPGLNQNYSYQMNAQTRNGLVYAATGTPTVGFTWD